MIVCYFGMYHRADTRNDNIITALRQTGCTVMECHYDLWRGRTSRVNTSRGTLIMTGVRMVWGWIVLAVRYLLMPRHDVVMTGAFGHADVPLARCLAWLRGVPLIVDVFVSLHQTVVFDRRLVRRHSFFARLLSMIDSVVCRCADAALLDTDAHIRYFQRAVRLPGRNFHRVYVSAPEIFVAAMNERPERDEQRPVRVFFYGTYIPLHGMPTIIEAAQILRDRQILFTLVGTGQEYQRCRAMIDDLQLTTVTLIPWMTLEELADNMKRHDIGLGIFGTSCKAGLVIPNKVYAYMAAGLPFITRRSAALRELCVPGEHCIAVPPGDSAALATAIMHLGEDMALRQRLARAASNRFHACASLACIGQRLQDIISELCQQ